MLLLIFMKNTTYINKTRIYLQILIININILISVLNLHNSIKKVISFTEIIIST